MRKSILRRPVVLWATLLAASLLTAPAVAQEQKQEQEEARPNTPPRDKEKITLQHVENPLSKIFRLPVEAIYAFDEGPDDRFGYQVALNPAFATPLAGNLDVVHAITGGWRYDAGIGDLPDQSGLLDTEYETFITPPRVGRTFWALGSSLVIPTGTETRLTADKWSAGPAAAVFRADPPFLYGLIASNIWSFAGNDARDDINLFRVQSFAFWQFPNGWFIMNNSRASASWNAPEGNQWLVPVGLGVGRLVLHDLFPSNVRVESYYRVERPEFVAPWVIRVRITLVLPRLERW